MLEEVVKERIYEGPEIPDETHVLRKDNKKIVLRTLKIRSGIKKERGIEEGQFVEKRGERTFQWLLKTQQVRFPEERQESRLALIGEEGDLYEEKNQGHSDLVGPFVYI